MPLVYDNVASMAIMTWISVCYLSLGSEYRSDLSRFKMLPPGIYSTNFLPLLLTEISERSAKTRCLVSVHLCDPLAFTVSVISFKDLSFAPFISASGDLRAQMRIHVSLLTFLN